MWSPICLSTKLIEIQTDVALVANFAEDLAGHPSGAQLVKYLLIFAPAWYVYSRCPSPSLPVLGPQVWRINFLRQREELRKILGESDAQSDALIGTSGQISVRS